LGVFQQLVGHPTRQQIRVRPHEIQLGGAKQCSTKLGVLLDVHANIYQRNIASSVEPSVVQAAEQQKACSQSHCSTSAASRRPHLSATVGALGYARKMEIVVGPNSNLRLSNKAVL